MYLLKFAVDIPPENNNSKKGNVASLPPNILISESAHLIWATGLSAAKTSYKAQYTRKKPPEDAFHKINQRLTLDRYIAAKWSKKPVTRDLVKKPDNHFSFNKPHISSTTG